MGILDKYWHKICASEQIKQKGVFDDVVAQGFMRPWNSDIINIEMLLKVIDLQKPQTIIELGTFEARTTIEMAQHIDNTYTQQKIVQIYTFDAYGPVSIYGNGKSEEANWQNQEKWLSWKQVREMRQKRIAMQFTNCQIIFVEGLIQQTLPNMLPLIGNWDLCYQDSTHSFDNIMYEWLHLQQYAHTGSIIVFDDITEAHPWREWFSQNNPGWLTKWTSLGREQLWAEKIE